MYLRAVHAEGSIPVLRSFIQANSLGLLTTALPSNDHHFIQTSHIPWVLDVKDPTSTTELGILRGHIARQNPQAKVLIEHAQASNGPFTLPQEVMVLFNGPGHHYVTPKFYTKTKPESGKVVPTWNYAAAQAYGVATVYTDSKHASTSDFLNKQIRDLSQAAETDIMRHEKPWQVDDAPERYIELLKKNIIGIEIKVTSLGGKFKMSQEMGEEDREGVVKGFESLGSETGDYVARTVKERGAPKQAGQ